MTPEERLTNARDLANALNLSAEQAEILVHELRNALVPTKVRHKAEPGPLRVLAFADELARRLDCRDA